MTQILVIDDEPVIRELMREILQLDGHHTIGAETAERALELLEQQQVSLVVSDIMMPGLSGLELLEEVHARRPSLPVILVTGAGTYDNLTQAVTRGADGLVIKPFSHADLQNAVSAALERQSRTERDLRERLLAPTLGALLANAIEARNAELQGHCERLGDLAARIAQRLGVSRTDIERIQLGAVLHDVGKIGIPDSVFLKPGALTDDERALMRTHTEVGAALLDPLGISDVRAIVLHHHERWDGAGYPHRLAGDAIPLAARIVAIADAVEAMSAPRPYRDRLQRDAIVAELERGRGAQWDPRMVDVVLDMIATGELEFEASGFCLSVAAATLTPPPRSVLVVEDDDAAVHAIESVEDVRVVHVTDAESAVELCSSTRWSLAVLGPSLPGDGLALLQELKQRAPTMPVVMLTREGSDGIAIEAFRNGATDYVVKANGFAARLAETVRTQLEAA
ncbi:MAG TPA: response regulator [Gaiellaceae bacterium]|nr:response regulator [Gaiellaceae bacterium]